MNMFKPKTAENPKDYINQIDEPRKSEIIKLHEFIKNALPEMKVEMFHNIIGYGSYHYKSKSGSEGDWFTVGLASQKSYISVYVCAVEGKEYVAEKHKDWFPKASIGKSCIRFKKVEDIDLQKLEELLLLAKKVGSMNGV
ncbi:MAG: DUF1801 domain-containing protein [Patescibacteria group bacterium]